MADPRITIRAVFPPYRRPMPPSSSAVPHPEIWNGLPWLDPGEREAASWNFAEIHRTTGGSVVGIHRPSPGNPVVYVSAGIHGDEPAGTLALARLWKEGFFSENIEWIICPALNPAGLRIQSRETPEGHDLNRDYLSLATVETRSHRDWLEGKPVPALFLSLHEDWESTGFYFYEINLGPDRPDRAARFLDKAARWFPPESGPLIDGHDIRTPGWIYHPAKPDFPEHWPEAIYLAHRGCPLSLTLETPSSAPLDKRVSCQAELLRHVLEHKDDFGLAPL
jgi:hypothetical protein